MFYLTIIAFVISIISLIGFSGHAYTYPSYLSDELPDFTMFQTMFGYKGKIMGFSVEVDGNTGMVILFVIQIILLIANLVVIILYYKKINDGDCEKGALFFSCGIVLFSLIAAIMSLCTINITASNNLSNVKDAKLGFAPIFYSILQFIIIAIHGFLIVKSLMESRYSYRHISYRTNNSQQHYQQPYNNRSISVTDELKKYKELLDSGAITQEEYDTKKKQLLKL